MVLRTGEAEREWAMQGMIKTMVVWNTEGDSELMKLLIVVQKLFRISDVAGRLPRAVSI